MGTISGAATVIAVYYMSDDLYYHATMEPINAIAVARFTGSVRLRHYPFLPERVLVGLDA